MPYRCVVGGFSRVSTDGVWLYFWPRDEAQAKLWDRFVRSYRLERRELLYHCTTPKKRRGTYEKGQQRMILDDIIPQSEVPDREKAWIETLTSINHPGWNGTIQHPLHEIHEGGFYCEESQDSTNACCISIDY
ncbi:hypothetical protein CAPTEDRAFT_186548 [Capitella teleta]|uniref:Uncharacterized protein n=1 Tax=Capitella teleta TaxID=283909 RepID=R7U069_CAPTE|nr:hypothetical protein CAPTEDRAFT_186548 [Capitella teleta]|eukprot:ELT99603.1 hypothetical protein CAPTEDRAFT_186548 [Capitella teleta]